MARGKASDIVAYGHRWRVQFRQTRWHRWTPTVVISPRVGLLLRTGFKAKTVRFKASDVQRVLYQPAGWGRDGLLVFELTDPVLPPGPPGGPDPLRVTFGYPKGGAFDQIAIAGRRYRWLFTR